MRAWSVITAIVLVACSDADAPRSAPAWDADVALPVAKNLSASDTSVAWPISSGAITRASPGDAGIATAGSSVSATRNSGSSGRLNVVP